MSSKQTLPAGKYYIGDPCYVIDDWDRFCGRWFSEDEGIFDFDGADVCVYNTQYGDGCFPASNGAMLGVDAGIIGAIPMELCTRGQPGEQGGTMIEFEESFECSRDNDGRLHFGDVDVMTGDDESECPECGQAYG